MSAQVPDHAGPDRPACAACGKVLPQSLLWCSRCESAWYCDAGCQKKDWPVHKKVCKERGAELFRKTLLLAEAGDPKAHNNIGMCYFEGWRVARDQAVGASWWRRAADAGDPHAQNSLALCDMRGEGVAEDRAETVRLLLPAAEAGLADAQTTLGVAYSKGMGGLRKDEAEAVRWFRRAAEQGHPAARYNLGCRLCDGRGGRTDPVEGLRLKLLAAESGLAEAQFDIGVSLIECQPPPPGRLDSAALLLPGNAAALQAVLKMSEDKAEGFRWLKLAAAQGQEGAVRYLARPGIASLADRLLASHADADALVDEARRASGGR